MTTEDTQRKLTILNDPALTSDTRLDALAALAKTGLPNAPSIGEYVNNHIHTTYSFSPYTPSAAAYYAKAAGLKTAGIMDHDSIGGCAEFIKAGEILSLPVTCGCELRVSFKGTPFEGRRLNNPDQISCAYVALHGIPHGSFGEIEKVISEKRVLRNERNKKMCSRICDIAKCVGIELDLNRDVLPLSQYQNGGSVTERHVLFALVKKLGKRFKSREEVLSAVEEMSGSRLSEKKRNSLIEAPDKFFEYDLLGVLKSGLIGKIYIDADDELIHVTEFIELARKTGAISAYAYLGDVAESPTGDKKAAKFEDDYLDELLNYLKRLGFNAVTFMPSRNTAEQLTEVMRLCKELDFFQISGEDINQPRQSFVCKAAGSPEFDHLRKATYALIGHEITASSDSNSGMFSPNMKEALQEKIERYSAIGGYKK